MPTTHNTNPSPSFNGQKGIADLDARRTHLGHQATAKSGRRRDQSHCHMQCHLEGPKCPPSTTEEQDHPHQRTLDRLRSRGIGDTYFRRAATTHVGTVSILSFLSLFLPCGSLPTRVTSACLFLGHCGRSSCNGPQVRSTCGQTLPVCQ